jgi:ATP-dependent RNA helicase RhlE
MTFNQLKLLPQIHHSLQAKGYTVPTPVQLQAIPPILEGKDIFASAQTGTGKTAAFALPILQNLFISEAQKRKGIKALVLAPTRELAQQISDSFHDYGRGLHLRHAVVYGGVSQVPQVNSLRKGVDILIATPGRLIDLINQRHIQLHSVEYFVLDEVDRMLDMGFISEIKKIIAMIPQKKQTLFFSATLPPEIKKLSDKLLHHPVMVQTAPVSSPAANVKQFLYHVPKDYKKPLLKEILKNEPDSHVLVFTRTKRSAERLAKSLTTDHIRSEAIHGDKTQAARQRALSNFKNRTSNLLVATDVASRGLHITDITHVVNFDLPQEAEAYVHRIGRTGRAGATGIAISFCAPDEKNLLHDIMRLIGNKLETLATPPLTPDRMHAVMKKEQRHDSRKAKPQATFGNETGPRHRKKNSHWNKKRKKKRSLSVSY